MRGTGKTPQFYTIFNLTFMREVLFKKKNDNFPTNIINCLNTHL